MNAVGTSHDCFSEKKQFQIWDFIIHNNVLLKRTVEYKRKIQHKLQSKFGMESIF